MTARLLRRREENRGPFVRGSYEKGDVKIKEPSSFVLQNLPRVSCTRAELSVDRFDGFSLRE